MKIANNITEVIGNTPIVRLNRVTEGLEATVLAKLEMVNIGGAIKARSALGMIEAAEKEGKVNKDTIFVEASTGNQGIAVAMICAAKGYKCIICMADHFGVERRKLMQAYGAELILTPTYEDMEKTIWATREMAMELERENPNVIYLKQFDNWANPETHRRTTAAEILSQAGDRLTAFVGTVGSGGTLSGVASVLKAVNPKIKIFGVEPDAAALEGCGRVGLHKQEGIGDAQLTRILARELIDEWMQVTDEQAINMSRRLAMEEGILCGISSGTAVHASIEVAKELGKNHSVLTIIPDTGERYMQTDLFNDDYINTLHEPMFRTPKSRIVG